MFQLMIVKRHHYSLVYSKSCRIGQLFLVAFLVPSDLLVDRWGQGECSFGGVVGGGQVLESKRRTVRKSTKSDGTEERVNEGSSGL